jgi:hypothetical protein
MGQLVKMINQPETSRSRQPAPLHLDTLPL